MRALTLHQPWATLVAEGFKTVETRAWSTRYRGPLLIHAAKRPPDVPGRVGRFGVGWHRFKYADRVDEGYTLARTDGQADERGVTANPTWPLPLGCAVAVCRLAECVPTERITFGEADGWRDDRRRLVLLPRELPYGDYTPGRFAWLLADIEKLDPLPALGRQGLWAPDPTLLAAVEAARQ